jgi:tetratricopeptide (TPR) repeat protein
VKKIIIASLAAFLSLSCGGNPDRAYELFLKGKEAYARKELDKAKKYFEEASELDENLLNARLMLSKISYFRRDFNESLRIIDSILEVEKNHVSSLFWKARTLAIMKKKGGDDVKKSDAEAIRCLQRVLELDGHHISARNLLALLYEKNRMYKEALYEYRLALEEEESLINTRANLSILYYRMGLKDRSLGEIERAIAIADAIKVSKKNLLLIKKEVQQ